MGLAGKAWAWAKLGKASVTAAAADACTKVQGQFTSGTCSITQKAAIAAMKADPIVLKDMIAAFNNRRKLVLTALDKMEGVHANIPVGAFYVFPDISAFFGKSYNDFKINNADDLCLYLLSEALVALVALVVLAVLPFLPPPSAAAAAAISEHTPLVPLTQLLHSLAGLSQT